MLIFTSIKIIHKWEHAKEYRLLADYFRLIGVFVCDCTLKREKFSDDFDFVFLLDKDFDKKDKQDRFVQFFAHIIQFPKKQELPAGSP